MRLLLRVPRVRWSVWHSWPAMGVLAAGLVALDLPRVAAFLVLLFSCGWFLLAALALAAMSAEESDTRAGSRGRWGGLQALPVRVSRARGAIVTRRRVPAWMSRAEGRSVAERKRAVTLARRQRPKENPMDADSVSPALMTNQPRPTMSNTGRRLFALGVQLNTKPPHAVRLEQIQREIAALLGEAMALDLGLTAVNLTLLPAGTQQRLSTLATRAIEWLDLDVRVDAASEAVAETLGWACQQREVRPEDLLREGLARYEGILCRGVGR